MTTFRSTVTILALTVFLPLTSCNWSNKKNEPVWSELPKVTALDKLKQTDFVVTLENPVSENTNVIYAPAFLYAWDKIKEELKLPIIVAKANSIDFNLLNNSTSHQGSLTEVEYSATAEVVEGRIIARAFFNKTLPFETKLQLLNDPIDFGTTKVAGFGMNYYNEEVIKFTEILYYRDDNNFILKLTPKDKQHEIILVKGNDKYRTFKDAINLTNDLISKGRKERSNSELVWKYQIVQEDMFAIPVIKFNIETHYMGLEGQNFFTEDKKQHVVEVAYQRTGFILNESGAVVESEVAVTVDSASIPTIISHPKKMIFDKPFLIIIKRAEESNPYFVMKVANGELLMRK